VPDIFISYRREDAVAHAGRLYDRLAAHFGSEHVFMDIDTIRPGEDFVEVLEKSVGACDVFITIIGRQWLLATDENGRRRIDVPEDYLRREVEIALAHNIRVIPVLVQGAVMPRPDEMPQAIAALARRQAFPLPDTAFHRAVDELIAAVDSTSPHAKSGGARRVPTKRPKPSTPLAGPLLHLPDSKTRRFFLLYRPPKVYGWLLRLFFLEACIVAPTFLVISVGMSLRGISVSGDFDPGGALAIAIYFGFGGALALRFLTVRLERKFFVPKAR
jgi:hypothetical protein